MVTFEGACTELDGILLDPVAVELLRVTEEVTFASVLDVEVVFTDMLVEF